MAGQQIEVDVEELRGLRRRSDALCEISGMIKANQLNRMTGEYPRSDAEMIERILARIKEVIPGLFGPDFGGGI